MKVILSRDEKYLISYSDQESTGDNVIVWDFYTKKKLRIFNLRTCLLENFDFSYDSKYLSGIK